MTGASAFFSYKLACMLTSSNEGKVTFSGNDFSVPGAVASAATSSAVLLDALHRKARQLAEFDRQPAECHCRRALGPGDGWG